MRNRWQRWALMACAWGLVAETGGAIAQYPGVKADNEAIVTLLHRQQDDWNRGDLNHFATGYKDAPDILFMGSRISRGYQGMLDGYRKAYPTREKMGQLTFSELEVQPVDPHIATATGHFHLQRTAAGGGNADGFFLLVLEKTPGGWKIIRDDTTALPAK